MTPLPYLRLSRAAPVAAVFVHVGVAIRALGETLLRRPDPGAAVWANARHTRRTGRGGR